jgi:hypothetical protein
LPRPRAIVRPRRRWRSARLVEGSVGETPGVLIPPGRDRQREHRRRVEFSRRWRMIPIRAQGLVQPVGPTPWKRGEANTVGGDPTVAVAVLAV